MAKYKKISESESPEEDFKRYDLLITDKNGVEHEQTIINNNPDGVFKGITSGIVPDKELKKFFQAYANTFDK